MARYGCFGRFRRNGGTRSAAAFLRMYFSFSTLIFTRARQPARELGDAVIEERAAALDRVRHLDAIALARQDVAGQQARGLEILALAERIPRSRTPPEAPRAALRAPT